MAGNNNKMAQGTKSCYPILIIWRKATRKYYSECMISCIGSQGNLPCGELVGGLSPSIGLLQARFRDFRVTVLSQNRTGIYAIFGVLLLHVDGRFGKVIISPPVSQTDRLSNYRCRFRYSH